MKRFSVLLTVFVCLALSACGGGGSSSSTPNTGPASSAGTPAPASKATAPVTMTITIPKSTTTHAIARRPQFVSTNTQSIVVQQLSLYAPYAVVGQPVVANTTAGSPGCTTTTTQTVCTVAFAATPGTFNFSVQSFSGLNGSGSLLAENTLATATIVAGIANALSVSLNGVIGSITFPSDIAATLTFPQTIQFSVQDPSGATIIGTGTYDNGPITVTDQSGLVTLTPASFAGPSTTSSFSLQCNAAGFGSLQFADAAGALGTMSYYCDPDSVTLAPASLSFDALAAGLSDPTYDQVVTATDTNTNVASQTPTLNCTPGPGSTSSTIATVTQGSDPTTWFIRPLDVGTCTFQLTDQFIGDGSQSSQPIPIEIHITNFIIESRMHRHNK